MHQNNPSGEKAFVLDQLEISPDGELLGLTDADLDAIAGGLMADEPTNKICSGIEPNAN